MARKKVVRKEKPPEPRWVVIDSQGRLKYQPQVGTEPAGFTRGLALSLAEGGWTAIPLSDYGNVESE